LQGWAKLAEKLAGLHLGFVHFPVARDEDGTQARSSLSDTTIPKGNPDFECISKRFQKRAEELAGGALPSWLL
jgi:hypothetical protein